MTNKKAFTLAEVLLTLSIIGVIAALTIPTVMFNTDKKISSTGLKRALATLNQAVDMSRTELKFQPAVKCYNGGPQTQCAELFDYIKDVVQVQKYCKEKPMETGCLTPDYNKRDDCIEDINNSRVFVTTDGMIYFERGSGAKMLGVDTNGTRGPNKSGYDIFYVQLEGTGSTMQTYQPVAGCIADGGISGVTLLNNDN